VRSLNKKYWPEMVQIDYDYRRDDAIFAWCIENFGRSKFYIVGSSTYYFQSEQDATLFRLKWA